MRWLICCLLLPLSAHAASVLLVPVDEKARVMADELVEPFAAAQLTVKMAGGGSPAHKCLSVKPGRDACLQGIAEKAKVVGVFIVSGALRGAKGTMTLELISGARSIKKESFKVQKGRIKTQLVDPVARLLELLPDAQNVEPVEQPKAVVTVATPTVDAPKKEAPRELTPAPAPEPAPVLVETPMPRQPKPKVAAWVVTGLAIAAAGTAATFGGLGLAGKGRLETAPDGLSPLTHSQAAALQQDTNTQFTVALGAGIGAGVGGLVAGILWGLE